MKQYIYGKNPIMEALKGASVYKIYMLNGHKDPKIFDICKRNQIPLEFVDKKEFDKKVGKVVHQGVMAYIENYRYYTIDEILKDIPENKQPLLLMLDGLEDPHNLGAILRTCDAVGVDGVIIGKNRSIEWNGCESFNRSYSSCKSSTGNKFNKNIRRFKKEGILDRWL